MIACLLLAVPGWPQSQPGGASAETQPALDPTVDKILTRLESRQVNDLKADVSWKLRYLLDLEEDAVTKRGRIWYQQQKPVAKFLVHFTQRVSSNRAHKLDERHLFDGRWYVELNSETKTLSRREIRREGETANPYRLGEGPFPLPFGQRKADILKEFEVLIVPPAADDPPETDHLKLLPREGSQTGGSYQSVEVWIARTGPQHGLPVKVHTAKKDGTGKVNSFITISFENVRLNEGFSSGVFEIEAPPGYDVEEERLEPIAPPETPPSKDRPGSP